MPIVIQPPNVRWFDDQREKAGLTYEQFAALMKTDKGGLNKKIHGHRKITPADVKKFAKIFSVREEEVLKHVGELSRGDPESKRRVAARALPVVGMVFDGGQVARKGVTGVKKVARPAHVTGDCVALRYAGGGMMTDWLFYHEPARPISEASKDAMGKLCVIEAGGESLLCSVVGENKTPGHLRVQKLNSAKTESIAVKSAAPVVWIKP